MKEGSNFKVDARTIFQLGREAIESEISAVSELVKNAYDADSTKCSVFFESIDYEQAEKIIIQDDGNGMSYEQVEKNWLRIGTNNKRKEKNSPKFGRPMLGEKGIGRLALNRLGNLVEIYTKTEEDKLVYFKIDFEDFMEEKELETIPINLQEINNKSEYSDLKGTKIIVSKLLDKWDKPKILKFKKEMEALQIPFSEYKIDDQNNIFKQKEKQLEENDFKIIIDYFFELSEVEKKKFDEMNNLLEYSIFRMKAKVNTQTGIINYTYSFNPYSEMDRLDSRIVINEDHKIIITTNKKPEEYDVKKVDIGIIDIHFFAYDFSTDVVRRSPINNTRIFKGLVRDNGGVKVYRDGHRVYNYGEKGNDWLGVDSKRVNRPGRFVSNNVLIGNVQLNRETSHLLVEKTNREGFIEDEASLHFKMIIQEMLFHYSHLIEDDKTRIKKAYSKARNSLREDEIYNDVYEKIEELPRVSTNVKDELKEGLFLYKQQLERIKEILINTSTNAMDYLSIFHDLEKRLEEFSEEMNQSLLNDEQIAKFKSIVEMVANHNSLLREKSEKTIEINDLIESIIYEKRYSFLRSKVKAELYLDETKDKKIKCRRADVIRIFENIFSNSLYWLQLIEGERKIGIRTAITSSNRLKVIIDDNGPGFSGDIEFLKEPFKTTKANGTGIGLGLFIIDELISNSNGYIELDNESMFGTGASVKLFFKEDGVLN